MRCVNWIAGARKTFDRMTVDEKKAGAPISPKDEIIVLLPADDAEAAVDGKLNCSLDVVLSRGRDESIRYAHDSTKPKGARGPKKKTKTVVETTVISSGSPAAGDVGAVQKTVTTETTFSSSHDTTVDLDDTAELSQPVLIDIDETPPGDD